jgi:hypothetical protein
VRNPSFQTYRVRIQVFDVILIRYMWVLHYYIARFVCGHRKSDQAGRYFTGPCTYAPMQGIPAFECLAYIDVKLRNSIYLCENCMMESLWRRGNWETLFCCGVKTHVNHNPAPRSPVEERDLRLTVWKRFNSTMLAMDINKIYTRLWPIAKQRDIQIYNWGHLRIKRRKSVSPIYVNDL